MFGCCWLCCLFFFSNNITVSCGSLENSEILRYTHAMKHCLQKPGISDAFSGTKYTKGARETLSCSFLLLPSFEHQRSRRQAENKEQLSVCPQRVACAHTRGVAANPAAGQSSSPAPVPVTTAACALPCLGDPSLEIQGLVFKSLHLD